LGIPGLLGIPGGPVPPLNGPPGGKGLKDALSANCLAFTTVDALELAIALENVWIVQSGDASVDKNTPAALLKRISGCILCLLSGDTPGSFPGYILVFLIDGKLPFN
jgi:hypothetical protein